MLIQKDEQSPRQRRENRLPKLYIRVRPLNVRTASQIGKNRPPRLHGSRFFSRSVANLRRSPSRPTRSATAIAVAEQDLLRDYDNLFRIMYNYPPMLDGVNIADALRAVQVAADAWLTNTMRWRSSVSGGPSPLLRVPVAALQPGLPEGCPISYLRLGPTPCAPLQDRSSRKPSSMWLDSGPPGREACGGCASKGVRWHHRR